MLQDNNLLQKILQMIAIFVFSIEYLLNILSNILSSKTYLAGKCITKYFKIETFFVFSYKLISLAACSYKIINK